MDADYKLSVLKKLGDNNLYIVQLVCYRNNTGSTGNIALKDVGGAVIKCLKMVKWPAVIEINSDIPEPPTPNYAKA